MSESLGGSSGYPVEALTERPGEIMSTEMATVVGCCDDSAMLTSGGLRCGF